ncbi:MAG TPA: ATP-dependent nuclease subunit B, partial [Clostridiales bacterium]|nr:ATP-dependent nuclease subunit B [Clostridiales bacterium]
LRRRVAGLLRPFVEELRAGGRRRPVRELAAALWNLLETLDIPATLERWHREALRAGRPDLAQEHERVLEGVVGLLDQMVENLGGEAVDITEFSRILEAGLETLEPGLVPPGLDQVLVGAVDRTRHPDIRACFVLGANEGVFPAVSVEDQVFSDQERDELAGLGMDLAPSSREKALTEDYLVYVALTRPSERLWVSYARADDDGRALTPSPLVARLKALFPGLTERPSGLESRPEELSSETEALSSVTRALSRLKKDRSVGAPGRREAPPGPSSEPTSPVDRRWLEVYNWLVGDPARLERTRTALRSVGYVNRAGPLEPDLAARIYGDPVRVSVSRLEAYAGCPFRHFASAGLGLEPRPCQQLKAPEIGSYYHAVLSLFTKGLLADGADLADLTQTEVSDRLRRAVDEVEPRLESEVLTSRARYRHLAGRLRRTVARTVEVLAEHARRGSFRPTGVEARFSLRAAGLWLRGFVDRLEGAPKAGRLYARVIDFKSGGRSYDLRRTYHGLDIQLPTYLLAATDPTVRWEEGPGPATGAEGSEGPRRAPPVPAGAFFFPVTDPVVSARGPLEDEDLERERAKKVQAKGFALRDPEVLRLMGASPGKGPAILPVSFRKDGTPKASKGLLSRDEMDLLLRFTRLRIRDLASGILRGRVSVAPYRRGTAETACRWCDYRAVCRFDPTAGDDYRRLPWPDVSEVWKLMRERVEQADDA